MDRYLTWNDALAKRFFHPGVEGAPVYFFVTEDVITEAGRTIGMGYEDFLLAVRAGPAGSYLWTVPQDHGQGPVLAVPVGEVGTHPGQQFD